MKRREGIQTESSLRTILNGHPKKAVDNMARLSMLRIATGFGVMAVALGGIAYIALPAVFAVEGIRQSVLALSKVKYNHR